MGHFAKNLEQLLNASKATLTLRRQFSTWHLINQGYLSTEHARSDHFQHKNIFF